MRALLILTVVALGMFWGMDTFELNGRYTHSFTERVSMQSHALARDAKGWFNRVF